MDSEKLLIISSDDNLLSALDNFLSKNGYEIIIVTTYEQIIKLDKQFFPNTIIIDYDIEDTNGFELILRRIGSPLKVIIIGSQVNYNVSSILKHNLSYDYINKPVNYNELLDIITSYNRQFLQDDKCADKY